MLENIMTREELYKECERLFPILKIENPLEQIISDFNSVYFNLNGDTNRMQIMANESYRDKDGYVKNKTHQLHRLTAQQKKTLSPDELYLRFSEIKKFCYAIQQIKAIDNIIEINSALLNADELNDITKKEIDKFYKERKRRSIFK